MSDNYVTNRLWLSAPETATESISRPRFEQLVRPRVVGSKPKPEAFRGNRRSFALANERERIHG